MAGNSQLKLAILLNDLTFTPFDVMGITLAGCQPDNFVRPLNTSQGTHSV